MKKLISAVLTAALLSAGVVAFAENEAVETPVQVPQYENIKGGAYCHGVRYNYSKPSGIEKTTVKRLQKKSARSVDVDPVDAAFEYLYDLISSNIIDNDDDINIEDEDGNIQHFDIFADMSEYPIEEDSTDFNKLIDRLLYESGELMLCKQYGYNTDDNNNLDFLAFNFIFEPSEVAQKVAQVDEIVDEWASSLGQNLTDAEKVLLAHDFVAQSTAFDFSIPDDRPEIYDDMSENEIEYAMDLQHKFDIAHSTYGVIVEGYCVCQGYAEAMCYVLNKIGIENSACVCDPLFHVWNCVKVNNKWYHVDVTWDDRSPGDNRTNSTAIEYTNFLNGFENVLDIKFSYIDSSTGEPVRDENGNIVHFFQDDFLVYPSHNLTNEDTENYEFNSGYIFNDIFYSIVPPDDYSLDPKGFTYENGKYLLTIGSTIPNSATEYTFTYDSIDAMPCAISKPELTDTVGENNDLYTFMMIGDAPNYPNNVSLTMSDENMGIDTVTLMPLRIYVSDNMYYYFSCGDYYFYAAYSDTQKISQAQSAKFFCWDGLNSMTPLSYAITL